MFDVKKITVTSSVEQTEINTLFNGGESSVIICFFYFFF